MKQIIVDTCLENVNNRFELVKIVSKRAKQLIGGLKPLVETKGEKSVLVSMREVAEKKVYIINNDVSENEEEL
ncbi:DNA-directed RNA polymerase subunit omega [Thermodesulfobacteriota bacterium]